MRTIILPEMIQYNDNITKHPIVSNVKTTSHQRYALYVTSFIMEIHTGESPHTKSIHTGEERYTHDIIVVSVIKTPN